MNLLSSIVSLYDDVGITKMLELEKAQHSPQSYVKKYFQYPTKLIYTESSVWTVRQLPVYSFNDINYTFQSIIIT